MPVPVLGAALIAGAAGIGVAGNIAKHKAQEKAAKENARLARQARRDAWRQLGLRQQQHIEASQLSMFETARSIAASQALASVSAGEAGVEGMSVDLLLGDFERVLGEAKTFEQKNLDATLFQLQQEKLAQDALMQSRIAQVPGASAWETVLSSAGILIDAGTKLYASLPA